VAQYLNLIIAICNSTIFELRDYFVNLRESNNLWCDAFFATPESERIAFLTIMIEQEKMMYCAVVHARLDSLVKDRRVEDDSFLRELHKVRKRTDLGWSKQLEVFVEKTEKSKLDIHLASA
jgi:hypothetical protein